MKKLLFVFIFALCLVPTKTLAADTGWTITSFNSDANIQTDGTVLFKETIAVDFESAKHGIYREIPYIYRNSDKTTYTKVDIQSVLIDQQGEQFTSSKNGDYVELKIGNPNQTITGKHTYDLTYVVTGILLGYADYDELYWNVTGNQWAVPIEHATASVTLPLDGMVQSSCYVGAAGSTESCTKNETSSGKVTFSSTKVLNPEEQLTYAVAFIKEMVPLLTVSSDNQTHSDSFYAAMIGTFLLVLIIGPAMLVRKWWKNGRDRKLIKTANSQIESSVGLFEHETIAPEFAPPLNLRPAEMNAVLTERTKPAGIAATIVDLAARGYLTITDQPKTNIFSRVNFVMTKTDKVPSDLSEYEKYLYDQLFLGRNEISTNELSRKFVTQTLEINKLIMNKVTTDQYFTGNPDVVRRRYLIWGIVLACLSPFLVYFTIFIGPEFVNAVAYGLAAGLTIFGAFMAIFAYAMPAKTALGHETANKILGYKMFIGSTEKYRAKFMENNNIFIDVLPYAIVFGLTDKLAKACAEMGIEPNNPTWYRSSTAFNMMAFSTSMNSFSTSMNAAAAPSGSGSGGGGFSGGGFGGGGGGSW
ncbi:MAG: DUF2207 domain-containing protein [Patescibacteria group bacterium]